MRNLTIKKLSIVLLCGLSSCAALGPDYKREQSELPATFSEADTGVASVETKQWWKHYQDEQLNELVELSLKNNKDIQLAIARIEEADASLREVGAALFPEINASAGATRTKVTELGSNPVFTAPIRNNYNLGLNTNFELDFWGKVRRAKESANATALASRYAKETVELSLIGLVSSNYLQLRGLEAQIAVSQDNLASRNESLSLTQRRMAGGIASSLEVSQAEVLVSNLQAQLIELNRLRALALHQLAILTGVLDLKLDAKAIARTSQTSTDQTTTGQSTTGQTSTSQTGAYQAASLNWTQNLVVPPIPPAGLPSALLENRPDVRQAEQALIAENAQIGFAKAALYPTISLTGNYGGESLELSDVLKSAARVWSFGLGLDLPIFDSGRRQSRVDQASARQKQALAQYQSTIQGAFREVNDSLITRRLNAERELNLTASAASAKKALAVAENRYKAGYSAYLEVLDAQRVYNEAALSAVQARQATSIASVELFKALGGDWRVEAAQNVNSNPPAASTTP